jgi:hypothetical protein
MNVKDYKNHGAAGTSLKGYFKGNINDVINLFGPPDDTPSGDSKVDWEWIYKLDEEVVTFYNYKDGPSYLNDKNITINDIETWHIGGNTHKAVDNLKRYFVENNIECEIYGD